MKTLPAIFALCTVLTLNQFIYAQDPAPAGDKPVVEDLGIPQRGPAAKPEYRHERMQRLKESFSDRLEARFQMIMKHLEKNNPKEYERLMELRQSNREKFAKEIWQHSPEYSETRKKIAELDKQCWDLAGQYKEAITEADKARIKAQLQPLIDESMQLVIKDTQERLEKLQNQLKEMEKDQDKVKEKRLEYFLTNDRPSGRPRLRRGPHGGPLPDMRANPYRIPVPDNKEAAPPATPDQK